MSKTTTKYDPSLPIGLLFFVGIWFFSDWQPFRKEVTVYSAFCKGNIVNGVCNSKEEVSSIRTYRADADHQTVIYWFDDGEPLKHENCVVRDAKNWACTSFYKDMDVYHKYSMLDGKYEHHGTAGWVAEESPSYKIHDVTKWMWWQIWLDEKTRN